MDPAFVIVEAGALLLAAAGAGAIARRIGLPAIVGYLLIGLAVGPFTPGYVADPTQLQLLANIGVVLLLFEIGLDTDLRGFARVGVPLFSAVVIQVVLTAAVTVGVFLVAGMGLGAAATLGIALAVSSTVVAVNVTRSRRRTIDERSGTVMVLWSVLQDILTIPAVAILAALLAAGSSPDIVLALARLATFAVLAVLIGGWIVPALLRRVLGEGDTFIVMVVALALLTAGLGTVVFGVPLALAAFIAGLAMSYRREATEARREILPFRDLFAVLFFVAIGTLIDPGALGQDGLWILLVLLVGVKAMLVIGIAKAFRLARSPVQVGIGLAQIGEFSFVVLSLGLAAGVISGGQYSAVLAVAVASIAFSAIAVRIPHPVRPALPATRRPPV